MNIIFADSSLPNTFFPLDYKDSILDIPVAGFSYNDALMGQLAPLVEKESSLELEFNTHFWPSESFVKQLLTTSVATSFIDKLGRPVATLAEKESDKKTLLEVVISKSEGSYLTYSWELLAVHEEILKKLNSDSISGDIRENVVIDGHLILGEGSVLLPGVYIEGNVTIGENSKIGPNCYIRGNTHIGDNCHVGQSVELKNCILMNGVSAGHLSYLGDTIVGEKTNFGAGTIVSNFRHDGKNHRSMINGELIETGRRKFGAVIGANVHTGIHTSIYPGRKIASNTSTRPGDIVQKDINE
jgi:bifunctional UDP-N-acetylglucosamine pyrophosphorylase/glucosamine-1-phosphate N-acetyltransferase